MYNERIQIAIDYIETNLLNPITLSMIAIESGYSMYHFNRIFKYTVGESLIEYVRKRKLTEAANELLATNSRIIDIAIKYGFESQQAFASAFLKMYNIPPGKYRKNGKQLVLLEKKILSLEMINHIQEGLSMHPKIVSKDTFYVVGIEYYGSNLNGEIPNLWHQFLINIGQIEYIKHPGTFLGVCDFVPDYDPRSSHFSYLACTEVAKCDNIPHNMVSKTIPPQRYAVFTHKGRTENLEDTYKYIYGTYFSRSEYELAQAPDFELYDERFDLDKADSEMDIYIPIK